MRYDVIIAGSGPAGTAAGFDLVSAGYAVLLLDRQGFPRKKPCAGGLTPKAVSQYAYDISGFIERTCHEMIILRPDGTSFAIREKKPLCHMTRRADLDRHCLDRFRSAGGQFQVVDRIRSMDQDTDTVTLHTSRRSFSARFLVGADGANSRIRTLINQKALQSRPYCIHKIFGLEADVRVSRPDQVAMTLAFFQDLPGYFWIFPKKTHVNVGIFSRARTPLVSVKNLADFAGRHLGTDQLTDVTGYPIGVGGERLSQSPGAGRVLLAGDAAGFAEPVFGEGIYFAVKSGRAAAAAVMGALTGKKPAVTAYARTLDGMRLDLTLSRYAAAALYRWPGLCLKFAAIPAVHRHFAKGYAASRSLSRMFLP
jgi:geranylgeranyl reductase family protein